MKRASTLLSLTAVLFVASAGQAGDKKLVHAGFCSAENPDINDVRVTEFIEALADVYVACPVVRDKLGTSSDLENFEAYFDFVAVDVPGSPSQVTVECSLFATNPVDGSDYDEDSETFNDTTFSSGIPEVTLTFDVNQLSSEQDRAYTLWCELTDGDVLGGILYDEPN